MLKPINKNVVILPRKQEEVTPGGIILPDSAKKAESQIGTVVAFANDIEIPEEGILNHEVIYAKYNNTTVDVDGETYIITNIENVYAILSTNN